MARHRPVGLVCVALAAGCAWATVGSAGEPLERVFELDTQQPRSIEIELRGGMLWQLELEQHGIDAALQVLQADGTAVGRFDSRMGSTGRDFAVVEPLTTTRYRIVIEAAERGVPPGRVTLRVEGAEPALLPAGLPAALRAESEGNRHNGRDAGRRAAAEAAFASAADAYAAAGQAQRAADALVSVAALLNARGEATAALAAYRRALGIYRSGDLPARVPVAQFAAAAILGATGEFTEASALLDEAIGRFADAGLALEAARARNCLCLVDHRREELGRAGACYRRVLDEMAALRAPRDRAQVLGNLGGVLFMQQHSIEAGALFEEALARGRLYLDEDELLTQRNNVALAARHNGDYQRALDLYLENIERARAGSDPVTLGRALNNAGAAYLDLGEAELARDYYTQALELRRGAGDRAGMASTLNGLAIARRVLGELEQARSDHRAALALATGLSLRGLQAGASIGLGRVALDRGEPAEALTAFSDTIELLQDSQDRERLDEALHGAGLAHLALGDPAAARAHLEQALALRERQAHPAARTETLYALARLEEQLGALEAAETRLDQALQLLESTRASLLGPELRASYLAAEFGIFELRTELLMRRHAAAPRAGFDRRALAVNERARARSLLEQIAAPEALLGPRASADLLRRERALQLQLVRLLDRRSVADRGAVREISRELRQTAEQIRRADPAFASMVNPAPLDASGIQAALGADVTLLQFSLAEPHSFLWVVDTRSVNAFVLPSGPRIENLARSFLAAQRVNEPQGRARGERLAAELGDMLLGQAWPLLGDRRLVIVADGVLHYTPFAALRDPAGTPLLAHHELVYAPSVSAVAMQRRIARPAPQRMLAVLADPVYSPDDERFAASAPLQLASAAPTGADALRLLRAQSSGVRARLPASRREAESIAALVPESERMLATGFAAERSLVTEGRLGPYRIVHFATHGVVDSVNPDASGLALSRYTAEGAPVPGFLSLADLYRLRLSADLVVLSACDTALGGELRGEGMIGLARSFMRAGAERVLASAWQIPDRSTAEFMESFYRRLLVSRLPAPTALREAQLDLLGRRSRAAPYFWAAFALNGDWR